MRIKMVAYLVSVLFAVASCGTQPPKQSGAKDDPQLPAEMKLETGYWVRWLEVEPGREPVLCIVADGYRMSCNWEEYNKSK